MKNFQFRPGCHVAKSGTKSEAKSRKKLIFPDGGSQT